jgi:hypothetical protein
MSQGQGRKWRETASRALWPAGRRSLVPPSSGSASLVSLVHDQEGGPGEEKGQAGTAEPSDEPVAPIEPARARLEDDRGEGSRAPPVGAVVGMCRRQRLQRSNGPRSADSGSIIRSDGCRLPFDCPGTTDAAAVVRVSRRGSLSRLDCARPTGPRLVVGPLRLRDWD